MFNFSQGNSFEDIMNRLLSNVDDTLDKRQGSIIYDALAPAAAELANCYIELDVYADQTYLATATGQNLDNKVADYGLVRIAATPAKRLAVFTDINNNPMQISLGSRFSIPNESGGYNFKVIENTTTAGTYIVECEIAGTVGNQYFGMLLPLESINNLGSAILTDIYIAGEDAETDSNLRNRTIERLNETSFGGNIADYKSFILSQDGIGGCLVLPIWNGGGTVKLVVITSSYNIPTEAKIDELQTLIDPTQNQGEGLGKAPIGHIVTVVAPTVYDLTISANISLESGYTLESLRTEIETAINLYIREIQQEWSNSSTLTIYIARLIAAVVSVTGVANVTDLSINGVADDLTINVMSTGNPYPMIEEIILNEN